MYFKKIFYFLTLSCFLSQPVYANYQKPYKKNGVSIVLHKGTYSSKAGGKAVYYAAHVKLSKKAYKQMHIAKAKGKRSAGFQTISEMVHSKKTKAYKAILAVNGPFNGKDSKKWNAFGKKKYTVKYHDYTEIYCGKYSSGKLGSKKVLGEATYSAKTGLLLPGTKQKGIFPNISMKEASVHKYISDTFHGDMGTTLLDNNKILGKPKQKSYCQRTFIGTNGKPGDFWIVVCNGRYSDGKSKGLNPYGEGHILKKLHCIYGYNLDGGGSTTMVYRGKTVNKQKAFRRCYDALYISK